MSIRRPVPTEHEDDLTAQAGWMYADLFLALMVIFLATISFVPELSNNVTRLRSSVVQPKSAYNYDKGLSLVYSTFDGAQIVSDINNFESAEKLPKETDIIYVQVIGGYNPDTEVAGDGTLKALDFSLKLMSLDSKLFQQAATNLGSSDQIASGQVNLRLTFAAKLKA